MLFRAPCLLLFIACVLAAPVRATAADAGVKPAAPAAAAVTPAKPAAAEKTASAGGTAPAAKGKATAAKGTKKPKAPKNPPVTLFTVNHKETFSLRLRDAQGKAI